MNQPFESYIPTDRALKVELRLDTILLLALLALIFGIRVSNLHYNTLFVDEAIYATLGRYGIPHLIDQNVLTWIYGSPFYPILIGAINFLVGEVGIRAFSALASGVAGLLVYRMTAQIFHVEAALWALLIFGMSAVSINLGQFAVHDSLAVPLLAGSLYCLVRASTSSPAAEQRYLLAAALWFVLAALTKYAGALYLPALCSMALILYLRQKRSLRPLLKSFLIPALLLPAVYVWINYESLRSLFAGSYGIRNGERLDILWAIWAEIGVITLLALAGIGRMIRRAIKSRAHTSPRRLALWALIVTCFLLMLFAAPLYHLITGNQHSVWKHTAYTLLFLTPFAGHLCAVVVARVRMWSGASLPGIRIIGALLGIAIVLFSLNTSLERNWGFQHSWPNAAGVVTYLRNEGLGRQQRLLAEGAQIYDYYLPLESRPDAINDTWYFSYGGLEGIDAMRAALNDHWFDYVVFDGYYTPAVGDQLAPTPQAGGYRPGEEETQFLSAGD